MASIFCAHREGPRGRWIEGTEKPMVAESEAGEWHEMVQRLCDDDGVFEMMTLTMRLMDGFHGFGPTINSTSNGPGS